MSHISTAPPTRAFAVVHIARAAEEQPIKTEHASDSPALSSVVTFVQNPALIVLCVLLYLASVLWFVVTSGAPSDSELDSTSTPYVWVVCVPYTTLMINKLLTKIRAMEAPDQPDELALRELGENSDDCEFGDHASHDAIAVVGDVCIYVIGILLVCYFILPWQLYVE